MPKFTIFFLLKATFFAAVLLYFAKRLHELGGWALPGVLIGSVLFALSCLPEFLESVGRWVMQGDKRMDEAGKANRANVDDERGSEISSADGGGIEGKVRK